MHQTLAVFNYCVVFNQCLVIILGLFYFNDIFCFVCTASYVVNTLI